MFKHGSITLEECWVTGLKNKRHEHHVVPRAYGGDAGPTVTLNADVHNLLHDCHKELTSKLGKGNERAIRLRYTDKVSSMAVNKQLAKQRFTYLVDVILNAQEMAKHSKNKRVSGYSASTHTMLVALTKRLKKSQSDIVDIAIKALHDSYFKGGK